MNANLAVGLTLFASTIAAAQICPRNEIFDALYEADTGNTPRGVVGADLIGNGRDDVVCTNEFDHSVTAFRSNAAGGLQLIGEFPAGNRPIAIDAGDLDGDGRIDLVVSNFISTRCSILYGLPMGQFEAPVPLTVGANPYELTIRDLNNDGTLDIAVGLFSQDAIAVVIGQGGRAFAPAVTYPVGDEPRSITANDFNADGALDLAIADTRSGGVSVLINNGDGTFQGRVAYATRETPGAVVSADFTRDGRPDLMVSHPVDGFFVTLEGQGDGTFAALPPFAVVLGVTSMRTRDVDNDTIPDVLVSGASARVQYGTGNGGLANWTGIAGADSNAVFLDFAGNGASSVAGVDTQREELTVVVSACPIVETPIGPGPCEIYDGLSPFADYHDIFVPDGAGLITFDSNNDGKAEIATLADNLESITVFTSTDGQGFSLPLTLQTGPNPSDLTHADVTADGIEDLLVACGTDGSVCLYRGFASGSFGLREDIGAGSFDFPQAIGAGDFNGDGHSDLCVAQSDFTLTTLLSDGAGGFLPAIDMPIAIAATDIITCNLNNDGTPDLVLRSTGTPLQYMLGNGDGTFALGNVYQLNNIVSRVLVADADGDGHDDMVALAGNQLVAYFNDGAGGFVTPPVTQSIQSNPSDAATVDINGDGRSDFAISYETNSSQVTTTFVTFYLSMPDRTFVRERFQFTGRTSGRIVFDHADTDGIPDMILHGGVNDTAVLFGTESGFFNRPGRFTFGEFIPPRWVASGDFDGDGHEDVITSGLFVQCAVMFGDGQGGFDTPPLELQFGSDLAQPIVLDFEGDGLDDFAIVDFREDKLHTFSSRGDRTFRPVDELNTMDFPNSIRCADINSDGITDLVVGSGDTDESMQIFRGRGDGSFALDSEIPEVRQRDFELGDINGDGHIDLLVGVPNTNARLFLGDGTGRLEEVATPITLVDVTAIDLADYDGDGDADIAYSEADGDIRAIRHVFINQFETIFAAPDASGVSDLDFADIDGDGRPDLVVTLGLAERIDVFGQNGNEVIGAISLASESTFGEQPAQTIVADLNGDGRPDLLTSYPGVHELGVLLNRCLDIPCPGDCDGDGLVQFNDLVAQLFEFESAEFPSECDVDGSGTIDFQDVVLTLFRFGECP